MSQYKLLHVDSVTIEEIEKMKKSDSNNIHIFNKILNTQLATSLKRAFKIIGPGSMSMSNLRVVKKRLTETFLTHDELRRMRIGLLKRERMKAEGIRLIREKTSCI